MDDALQFLWTCRIDIYASGLLRNCWREQDEDCNHQGNSD
jgi:hypothetical protein